MPEAAAGGPSSLPDRPGSEAGSAAPAGVGPRFSVIVPVHEGWADLPGLFAALAGQDCRDFELIVVDNDPVPRPEALVRGALPPALSARFRLVRCPRPGSYAARNAGAAVAGGARLVFTDADCRPRPGWLSALGAAEEGDAAASPPGHGIGSGAGCGSGGDPGGGPERSPGEGSGRGSGNARGPAVRNRPGPAAGSLPGGPAGPGADGPDADGPAAEGSGTDRPDAAPTPPDVPPGGPPAALPGAGALLAGPVRMRLGPAPGAWEIYDAVRGIPQDRYVARGYATTANLSVPAPVFRALGGFDAARFSGGDAEFCRRAGAAGHPLRLVPGAVVEHPARAGREQSVTKARRVKGGQVASGPARRRLLWVLRSLLPPLPELAAYLRDGRHPWRHRLVAGGIRLRLWTVELAEIGRLLLLRRPPERR